jgi:hypothetical protein
MKSNNVSNDAPVDGASNGGRRYYCSGFSRWHSAKEVRVWTFSVMTWAVLFCFAHYVLDVFAFDPLRYGFLGNVVEQDVLYSIESERSFEHVRRFPLFFSVLALPLVVIVLRHLYVRWVK